MTANLARRASVPRARTRTRRADAPAVSHDFRVPVDGLALDAGDASGALDGEAVIARLTGPADAPVCAVLGGISASRRVAADTDAPGWWPSQVGPGRAIDTALRRVLSFEWLAPAVREPAPLAARDAASRAVWETLRMGAAAGPSGVPG